jgi:hypothetical protein
MDTNKQRGFSMKYCPDLDDCVIVMKTAQNGLTESLCLSSHLCHADERKRCGQKNPFEKERQFSINM